MTRIRARFPVSKSSSVVPAESIVDRPPSCIGIIEEAEFVEGEEGEQRVTNVSTPLVRHSDRYLFRGKLIDGDPLWRPSSFSFLSLPRRIGISISRLNFIKGRDNRPSKLSRRKYRNEGYVHDFLESDRGR